MHVAGKAAQVPFLSAVDPHKFIVNAPINVNPVRGGGGSAGNGWGFDQGIHLLSGSLIDYLCSGVGTFALLGRETEAKIKRGYLASSFLSLEWRGFRRR